MNEVVTLLDSTFSKDYKLDEVVKHNSRLYDYVAKGRGNDTLLITIGDSWTYGYRLDEEVSDDPNLYRVQHCYGNVASDILGYDFLNFSVPAVNNLWMAEKFEQFCAIADDLPYKNIVVFITLTEYGREIYTDFDDISVIHEQYYSQSTSTRDMAVQLSKYVSKRLLECKHPKITLHTGINYVTNLYPGELTKCMLEKNWLEIILGKQIDTECIVVGSWVIPKYENILEASTHVNDVDIKKELLDMVGKSNERLGLIYNSGLNHTTGYGHPNSKAHKLWGDYIATSIGV